ncbi:MAG: 30S ribosomal protein S19e [Halobacteriota archaeon]|nr:30S ribosomal protein S19e [Halobacteriota archaeon]
MTTIYDVPADELIRKVAQELKEDENISPPDWSMYVKTGVNREFSPLSDDWWFTRCASLLRRIYIDGPVGVSRLRTFYGGRNRKGVRDARFAKGGESIIRGAIHQLEKAGYLGKVREGRVISPKGQSFLDKNAYDVKKEIVKSKRIPELKKY